MQYIVGGLGATLLFVAFSSGVALAESHTNECEGVSGLKDITQAKRGEHTETHAHNYACLLAEIKKLRGGSVMPAGAVVAFDLPNGCPVGWQADISAAAGRMIVGVDGDQYRLPYEQGQPVYVTGGSETHELKLTEMPAHGHRISTDHSRDDIHDGLAGFSHEAGFDRGILTEFSNIPSNPGWTTVLPNVLEKTGGLPDGTTQPHNNMPPYIALYYCKKE